MKILMGTDPEFLILGPDGKPVPAHRFFPGKDEKISFPIKSRGLGKIFRDGFALELNVPPSHCRSVLADSVMFGLKKARQHLPKGYSLAALPAWRINPSSLRKAPLDVQIFGCDPALDAYTGEERRVDLDGAVHPMRYAGGHMHFSMSPAPAWMRRYTLVRSFVKLMDLYVGVPLTYIYSDPLSFARRRYYGQAGEFRLQNYPDGTAGIEYRVPDPRIWNNVAIALMAFGVGRSLVERFTRGQRPKLPISDDVLQNAINSGIGLREILPNLRGWYGRSTIEAAKEFPAFHRFALGKPVPKGHDCDFPGWRFWRMQHGYLESDYLTYN